MTSFNGLVVGLKRTSARRKFNLAHLPASGTIGSDLAALSACRSNAVTYMSTKVFESAKGLANSMAFKISPWQYRGESQGAVTEPLT